MFLLFHIFFFICFVYFIFFYKNINHFENFEETKKENVLNFSFLPYQNGYFQIGTFLLQWGTCTGGIAGKNTKNFEANPGLTIWFFGLTLDITEKRLGWETGVSLPVEFDEIYGVQAIPFGKNKGTIYENLRVTKMENSHIKFRTSSGHSPFFWFAYGLRTEQK